MTAPQGLLDNATSLIKAFRVFAFVEALSWLGLLISMGVKYGADNDKATFWPGLIHGVVFVIFVVLTVLTGWVQGWTRKVTLLGLLSTIPPFCSVIFEMWAQRSGLLEQRRAPVLA